MSAITASISTSTRDDKLLNNFTPKKSLAVESLDLDYFGLFDCCKGGIGLCLTSFCCPVCINTRTNYKLSTGRRLLWRNCCCVPLVYTSFFNRKAINRQYDIENSNFEDCMATTFCYPCSVVQNENNYRIIEKNRHSQ